MKNFDELRAEHDRKMDENPDGDKTRINVLRGILHDYVKYVVELEEEIKRLTYQRDKALADAKMFEEIAEENQRVRIAWRNQNDRYREGMESVTNKLDQARSAIERLRNTEI